MNICLFSSVFFNNIGNGFIDIGAEAALHEAISQNEDSLILTSQCANFAASMGKKFLLKEIPAVNSIWKNVIGNINYKLHDRSYKSVKNINARSIMSMIYLDVIVVPGCVFTVPFFTIYGNLLKEKVCQGSKIIFLGVSGNYYTKYEIDFVSKFLKELKPHAIITRDKIAFDNYSKYSNNSYDGIDNAFFVDRIGLPKLNTIPDTYDVVNLEEPVHRKYKIELLKKLNKEKKIVVNSNHKPFPYSKVIDMVKSNIMVSDYPMDYLILYRNADTVYSDRVHACIPTIAFGNKAVLISETKRAALFDNIGVKKEKDGVLKKTDFLKELQDKQILYLKNVIKEL